MHLRCHLPNTEKVLITHKFIEMICCGQLLNCFKDVEGSQRLGVEESGSLGCWGLDKGVESPS